MLHTKVSSPFAHSVAFLMLKIFLFHTGMCCTYVCMHTCLSRYVLCYTHMPSIRVHHSSDFPLRTSEMSAQFRPWSRKRDCMHPVLCIPRGTDQSHLLDSTHHPSPGCHCLSQQKLMKHICHKLASGDEEPEEKSTIKQQEV